MINKAFVYPYSREFSAYLRHIKLLNIYNVVAAVTPGKWGDDTCDAGCINGGENIGIPISYDFVYWLNKCDTVIWANYDYNENDGFRKNVLGYIRQAIATGKNVVCLEHLSSEEVIDFQRCAKDYGVIFLHETNDTCIDKNNYLLKTINVPIISVIGMAENCSKFDTELAIYRLLTEKGYNVSLISSKRNADLLGIQSFPSFMFSSNYGEIEKMKLFSSFLQHIVFKYHPDVIVLGVPGGLIPFNDIHNMHYGITAYEVFSIVKPDYNIINVWVDYLSDRVIKDLINVCRFRHGIIANAIGVSNVSIYNDHSTIERKKPEYNVYELNTVEQKIIQELPNLGDTKIYNVLKQSSIEELVNNIVDTLSE